MSHFTSKKMLISGASGFIGSKISDYFSKQGYIVYHLVRKPSKEPRDIFWDYTKEKIDLTRLEDMDVVINLSGESIADGMWTKEKKKRIYSTRIEATTYLVKCLNELKHPPKVFISASAVGIYGGRKEERLDESSSPGAGFLADVVRDWEKAASQFHGRSVYLRFGVVMGSSGGVLKKLILPFSLGLGAILGDPNQWLPWVSIDDAIQACDHVIHYQKLSGPVNVVSREPSRQVDLMWGLARFFKKPLWIRVPSFLLKWIFQEKASLVLDSQKVYPKKLIESGMKFIHPSWTPAVRQLVKK